MDSARTETGLEVVGLDPEQSIREAQAAQYDAFMEELRQLPPHLRLLRKLDIWLRQQEEWSWFLNLPRSQKRQVAFAIGKAICRIPHRGT